MCGIAGLALHDDATVDPAAVDALLRALAHRGPDGSGRHVAGNVALAQTRLAIVDLATGDQPLHAGPVALVANGEIYNDLDLRAAGEFACATGSDCEPPLHLWRRDGDGFAVALRGMYAIAIHDAARGEVALARDPFGIKPLYVAALSNGMAFASEPQALVAAGLVAPRLRHSARDELLQMQFTTGRPTLFDGIDRVLPGETLILRDGAVVRRERLAALPVGGPVASADPVAALDAALTDSVARHLRSDVPYGLFLSGGLDSAAILALMARGSTQPVRAFTAAFDVPDAADERAQAARVAASVGARHDTLLITEAMVWRDLPKIVAAMDDPAADYAIIPSWFLAREARREVKVVLSGEGGDEMLAGYGRYRSAVRPWWLGGRAMRARGVFDRLDVLRARPDGWRDGFAAATDAAATPGRTRLMVAQAADVADWLPHDLLLKLDRCLMAHGIEGRTPFVDTAVAAALFRLPDAAKRDGRLGKRVLREWLSRHLPVAEPFRRKQGFTVPIGAWIAGQGERLGALVAAQPGVAEVARPDRVAALFRDAGRRGHGQAAWTLLFFALWHQRHMLGRPVDGDVFAALAAR